MKYEGKYKIIIEFCMVVGIEVWLKVYTIRNMQFYFSKSNVTSFKIQN